MKMKKKHYKKYKPPINDGLIPYSISKAKKTTIQNNISTICSINFMAIQEIL
jgi:hypothetical protein